MKAQLAALLLAVAALSAPRAGDDQTHATRGVVKSAAPASIVIARPRNRGDITIALQPATHIDGTLRVGATVSVRYYDDRGRHVATAVAVERQVNRN